VHKLLAFARLATAFDQQETSLEQATDLVLNLLAVAGQTAGCFVFGGGATALQLGLGLGQAPPRRRNGTPQTWGEILEGMEDANGMRHLAQDRADGLGIEGRAIGGDALQGQITMVQRPLQAPQKGGDVVMAGVMIEHLRENAFVGTL